MDRLSYNFTRLRRFAAEHLGITLAIMPVFLVITCLAVLTTFSIISCSSPPTSPLVTPRLLTHTPVMTPTARQTLTATLLPTPTLHPSVTLIAPENGADFDYGSEITLCWNCPRSLEADERYLLRVWGAEQTSDLFSLTTTEDQFDLSTSDFSPGAYKWAVAVVNSTTHEPVSEESESFHFHIVPPPPVVYSISPVSILRGTSVPVVISGENFEESVALTIGVPLQATFVNSSTIIATAPMTLEVGKYPVIVVDPRGRGASTAFLTVKEPSRSTPTPATRWYPPPKITGISIIERNVTFRWDWSGELAKDEWFAVRVGKLPDIPHSQYWGKEREYVYSLCTLGGDSGDYVWEVAICRGSPEAHHCSSRDGSELAVSERGVFSFEGWPCG
jgi:hypothetical protein